MTRLFVDPFTKQALERDSDGNLFCNGTTGRVSYRNAGGCYDFSNADPALRKARETYDEFYGRAPETRLTVSEVTEPWFDSTVPWRQTMLANLGELSGKRILLLGNGESYKEFYFVHLGAEIVFTDLSLVAACMAQAKFRNSELCPQYESRAEFHAVDAMHLPFADQDFDIVYGTKFVGFLPDVPAFLGEVSRCLKDGGIARFADDAFSPLWESLRQTIVRPVKARWGSRSALARIRSGERFGAFGLKKEELAPFVDQCGFRNLVFIRQQFFLRAAQLCLGKAFRWNPKHLRYVKPLYLVLKALDNSLAGTTWMKKNSLGLTWGFDK